MPASVANLTGVEAGDTAHFRSSTAYGKQIRRCIPAWGNHDGTVVAYPDSPVYVAESVGTGFVLTPWEEYEALLNAGKTSVVFFRHFSLSRKEREHVAHVASEMTKLRIRYDWKSIIRIYLNIRFKRNRGTTAREWEWYCTEAVARIHHIAHPASGDIWHYDTLPTPYTTEKRWGAGWLYKVHEAGVSVFTQERPQELLQ